MHYAFADGADGSFRALYGVIDEAKALFMGPVKMGLHMAILGGTGWLYAFKTKDPTTLVMGGAAMGVFEALSRTIGQ